MAQRHGLGLLLAFLIITAVGGALAQKKQTASSPERLAGIPSGKTRILDLSYAINDKLVGWPGDARVFETKVNASAETEGYFTRSFWMLEHYGTHLDAPIHFPPGKTSVDKIAPEKLFGPAVVIDVRAQGEKDPDYQVPPSRVLEWESKHGRIPAGAIVLLRTGWSAHWPDVKRYRNQDAGGTMHFPGISLEAARLLLDRGISGIGCDTLSVEYGASKDFAVHRLTLGSGIYHLENLADLGQLPEYGAMLIAAPIKLEGGSGGPVRVFAILP